jgi:menaquinone-dependent protoporphyrinogen oxidase
MPNPILIAYASRGGSTAGVAEAIGKTLAEGGVPIDVRPMAEVTDLTPYRAVVAGSAINGGKWLPEAMQFVEAHQAELAARPFAAFLVCITLAMKNQKYREHVATWLDPVRALVRPVSEGHFAGMFDARQLPPEFNTFAMRAAVALGIFPKGDHRDWAAIRTWAESLRPLLM